MANTPLETEMVDVSHKPHTTRVALACGKVVMQSETLKKVMDEQVKKGDVLTVAQLAGIQGAKKCADWVPLCHPLPLSSIKVWLTPKPEQNHIYIEAQVKVNGPTGVEMEALSAVSAAALTVYDMCKGMDKSMAIQDIVLLTKTGGKSGDFVHPEETHYRG